MKSVILSFLKLNGRGLFAIACIAGITLGGIVGCVGGRTPTPEARAATSELTEVLQEIYVDGLSENAQADLYQFSRIFERVKQEYVHEIEDGPLIQTAVDAVQDTHAEDGSISDVDLIEAATHAMLLSLDPYSDYLNGTAYKALKEDTDGKFGGLGIEITKRDGLLRVVSPIEGTPASRAGMLPGDIITHADGTLLEPLSLRETVNLLRGDPGTSVRLDVERKGEPGLVMTITREFIRVVSVRARLEGDIGYIRLSAFTTNAGEQIIDAYDRLTDENGSGLRGVVLDLRNNPGGLLDQSVEVADIFLDPGMIVYTKSRRSGQEFFAKRDDMTDGVPIIVLINGGSASASEIVAGALKDRGRATLLGEKSFGKGSVQTIFPLDGVRGMKLTTALYYTPGHKSVEGGIIPDIELADDPDTEEDEQLDRALELIVELAASGVRDAVVPN